MHGKSAELIFCPSQSVLSGCLQLLKDCTHYKTRAQVLGLLFLGLSGLSGIWTVFWSGWSGLVSMCCGPIMTFSTEFALVQIFNFFWDGRWSKVLANFNIIRTESLQFDN